MQVAFMQTRSLITLITAAAVMIVSGCASVPSAIKFTPGALAPDEKMGLIVTMDYPYVSSGSLPDAIVDSAQGTTKELRKKLFRLVNEERKAVAQRYIDKWPAKLNPHPILVKSADVTKKDRKIDYPATASKLGIDVLIHVNIFPSLMTRSNNRAYSLEENWLAGISVRGSMTRYPEGTLLWNNTFSGSIPLKKGKYDSSWSSKLDEVYRKMIETKSSSLLMELQ